MYWRKVWVRTILGYLWLVGQAFFTYYYGLVAGLFCFGGGLVAFCLGLVTMTPDEAELLAIVEREMEMERDREGNGYLFGGSGE